MEQPTTRPASDAVTTPDERGNGRAESSSRSWPYIVGGSALMVAATRSGLLRGLALSGAGAATIYRGAKGHWPMMNGQSGPPEMSATVTINRPVEELFDLWRDLESFQSLAPRVDSVAARGKESHWEASLPVAGKLEWDAEITHEERPNRIEWRATNGPVPMRGSVTFKVPPGNRGTEVMVRVVAEPPGGKVGAKIAGAVSRLPERQMRRDLIDFKRQLEAGELATVDGQPHGRRLPTLARDGSNA